MRPARGQTLALFSLTLLLVVLMVMISLSIGTRIKERIELQNTADAAAYSEAVVRARAFNAVALMNRAQISHLVGLATVSSLISWSGAYRGALNQAQAIIASLRRTCTPTSSAADCECAANEGDLDCADQKLADQIKLIDDNWDLGGGVDVAAGEQQRRVQGIAVSYHATENDVFDWAQKQIEGGAGLTVAERVAQSARRGSPWAGQPDELFTKPLSGPGSVTFSELEDAVDGVDIRNPVETAWTHAVQIAMGTRGRDPNFVNGRDKGGDSIRAGLETVFAACGFAITATNRGSGYFGLGLTHGAYGTEGASFSWACDHADITVTRTNPPNGTCAGGAGQVEGYVKSTDDTDPSDSHVWSPGAQDPVANPAPEVHDLLHCVSDCPGIWPMFIDYDRGELDEPENVWGQPKNMVVMMRDFAVRTPPDPWALSFRFRFTPAGQTLDLRKSSGATVQTALSTGMTYYHRGEGVDAYGTHWREQPNFFNPFWRATLVAPDVDEPYRLRGDVVGDSARKTLQTWGAPPQAQRAMDALIAVGFKGLQ